MSRPEHPTLEMPAPGGRVDRFTLERSCGAGGGALELAGDALDRADRLVREAAGAVVERSVEAMLACFSREEDAQRARAAIAAAEGGASLRIGVASGPVLLVREADGVALFGATVVRARLG
jgi:class 3 adenylate cyclase